jgi:hypothetical protein
MVMNERIRKIAIEADAWCDKYYFGDKFYDIEWEKKFAELIVRECANHCDLLLDHKISSEWSRGTHDCSRAIKKHFGVEE